MLQAKRNNYTPKPSFGTGARVDAPALGEEGEGSVQVLCILNQHSLLPKATAAKIEEEKRGKKKNTNKKSPYKLKTKQNTPHLFPETA